MIVADARGKWLNCLSSLAVRSGAILPKTLPKRRLPYGRYPQSRDSLFRPDLHRFCLRQDQGAAALPVFALMLLFGPFAQPWAATAVLMASLPPALNVFVIARQNNTWVEPASVAVLIGTFASVVTLTSVMWLIRSGRLVFP